MWFLPLRITLELKKTRSSWTLMSRGSYFSKPGKEGQAKACLPLQDNFIAFPLIFPIVFPALWD